MKRVLSVLKKVLAKIVVGLLMGLIRLAWRPKMDFVSEAAREAVMTRPCVLISNHIRGMDGAVIITLLHRVPITALVAQDMIDGNRLLALMMHVFPCMPIDRRNVSLTWLRESRRRMRAGESIYLCPEGRCNFAKVVRPFKAGFVTLAVMADVPVVPIYHNGEYNYFHGRRWRMLVGEPVRVTPPPEGVTNAVMTREAEQLRQAVLNLERQLNGTVRCEPVDWEE